MKTPRIHPPRNVHTALLAPLALAWVAGAACAHANHATSHRPAAHLAHGAAVASLMQPQAAPGPQQQPPTEDTNAAAGGLSASAWLERALDALQSDRPELASDALRAALATGDLNDAGRSLAYWYVYVAEQAQAHGQNARNALADFVVVGEEVLAQRNDVRFADRAGSDFVDRFDLEGRLARSRATLSLAWAERARGFGRSADKAVPVRSDQEMAFFLELAPPCAQQLDRQATQQAVAGTGGAITHVELRCDGLNEPASYFFESFARPVARAPKKQLGARHYLPTKMR